MPLQGKMSIGLLTEDNPYKSYFVYKPLYVREGDAYKPLNDAEKLYPEDGMIRIVPDKNEMNTFKARMRSIGALCAMDLRNFPSENNKIRPNKNYSREMSERNQYIVYSDVLTPLSPLEFAEVVDGPKAENEMTLSCALPLIETVALRTDGVLSGPYQASILESEEVSLRRAEGIEAFSIPEEDAADRLIRIRLEDGGERLLLVCFAPAEVPVDLPQTTIAPLEEKPEAAKDIPKPWITRDDSVAPAPSRAYLSTRDQFMAAQSGLNPRRGRSLSEVVDDQWRRSRVDQLGHPVPATATARPRLSPVDLAVDALSEAWRLREARPALLNNVFGIPELREALRACFIGNAKSGEEAAFEAALNEYEANRLKLAMEIDELRAAREEVYQKLMVELRARNASEVSALEGRKERLASEVAHLETEVSALENRARSADAALGELFGGKFDERIAARIFEDRTLSRLSVALEGRETAPPRVQAIEKIERDVLIDRVEVHLQRAGFFFSREEVINLLILVSIGDPIVLSGAPGSGHTSLAKAFADAIGVGLESVSEDGSVPEGPCVAQLNDVNGSERDDDALSRFIHRKGPVAAFAVAHDAPDGNPLSQKLLCSTYFLRLKPPSLKSPWGDYTAPAEPMEAVSFEAIADAFTPVNELPSQMEMKLSDIRAALSNAGYLMGRETLSGLWRYCAAGVPHLSASPIDVLDFALAERALPAIMASMEPRVLRALPSIFNDLPRCKALMAERLPLF